jgi:hypothetical protein
MRLRYRLRGLVPARSREAARIPVEDQNYDTTLPYVGKEDVLETDGEKLAHDVRPFARRLEHARS